MDTQRVEARSWRREDNSGQYLVSTSNALLDHDFIQEAYETSDMYWAKRLPPEQLSLLLASSQNFGVYRILPGPSTDPEEPSSPRTPSPTLEEPHDERYEQIGFARFITDYVTTTYITDVYLSPGHRGTGLGKWLIACCKDVLDSTPAMRRAVLMASPDKAKEFYARELGFWDVYEERDRAVMMTKRGFVLH